METLLTNPISSIIAGILIILVIYSLCLDIINLKPRYTGLPEPRYKYYLERCDKCGDTVDLTDNDTPYFKYIVLHNKSEDVLLLCNNCMSYRDDFIKLLDEKDSKYSKASCY